MQEGNRTCVSSVMSVLGHRMATARSSECTRAIRPPAAWPVDRASFEHASAHPVDHASQPAQRCRTPSRIHTAVTVAAAAAAAAGLPRKRTLTRPPAGKVPTVVRGQARTRVVSSAWSWSWSWSWTMPRPSFPCCHSGKGASIRRVRALPPVSMDASDNGDAMVMCTAAGIALRKGLAESCGGAPMVRTRGRLAGLKTTKGSAQLISITITVKEYLG